MSQYSLTRIAYESCHVHGVVHLFSKIDSMLHCRLVFQPFCEPMFLAPYHGWITGLPVVFFDQSQPSLLKLSRLPCDWSILSLFYPTWRSTWRNCAYELLSAVKTVKCVLERFHIDRFRETQQDAILNL